MPQFGDDKHVQAILNFLAMVPPKIEWMVGFCKGEMQAISATEINKLAWHTIDHEAVLQASHAVVYAEVEALCPEPGSETQKTNDVRCTKLEVVWNEAKDGGSAAGLQNARKNDYKQYQTVPFYAVVKYPSKARVDEYQADPANVPGTPEYLEVKIRRTILKKADEVVNARWTRTFTNFKWQAIPAHQLEVEEAADIRALMQAHGAWQHWSPAGH